MSLDLARQQIKFKKNINVSIVTYTRSNEHRSIGTRSKKCHIPTLKYILYYTPTHKGLHEPENKRA